VPSLGDLDLDGIEEDAMKWHQDELSLDPDQQQGERLEEKGMPVLDDLPYDL
jgi:hypothetical protein